MTAMTTDNPLLATAGLPRFSAIRPEHVVPAVDAVLADYRARIDGLLAAGAPRDFARVILAGQECEDRLNLVWAPVSHLHGVADSDALRKVHSAAQEKIVEHASELGQNRELHAAVKAVAARADTPALPRAARTLIEHELRDFRLSGVALEEPARTRFREIANELSKLATGFEEAVLDVEGVVSVRVWELPDRVEIGVRVARSEVPTDVLKRVLEVTDAMRSPEEVWEVGLLTES